ncbi:hypothetical protein GCM10008927_01180 [Amylibacter ulvae]|uniref:DedA family protein n=1 Tax=Paramylibacter ulvae TaxID=1651968 RepID=A0ABQ3CXD2_9RHOB|nr:hypothetical protein [Amylibacter ulvae]GHA40714.1 hypothetical protein GCM10008927_01180 [Amylibacter ulvae]
MMDHFSPPRTFYAILRTIFRLLMLALIIAGIFWLMSWSMEMAKQTQSDHVMFGLIAGLIIAYIILISIPFVPGIEIALSLMLLHGPEIVLLVYAATVLGLLLAFLLGQFTPYRFLHKVFRDLHMRRACDLLQRIAPLSPSERVGLLRDQLPKPIRRFVIDGRYVLVGLALSIPGNALLGGGGGIMLIAGLSRLFTTPLIMIMLLIAVAPIPVAILVFDIDPMAFLRG